MNKTFKVIWSKARNAYIVVSELAKNYCRASKTVAAAVMVSVLAGTMAASPAWGKVTEDTQKYTVVTGEIKTTKDDHNNPSGPLTYTTADMAIGSSSVAKGDKSTAIGNNSNVDGDYSIAIGNTSMVVNGSSSVAIGNHSTATGAATTVIGDHASGVRGATVIGKDSEATGIDSVAIGVLSNVHNGGGVAIGRNAVNDIDSGDGRSKPGVSIGDTSKAYGQSIAIGAVANALGSYSIAIGASANASGSYSIAFGEGANALGKYSIAFGEGAKVKNGATGSSIFGQWSTISADAINSVINGSWSSIGTNAFGSTAVGNGTKVEDNSSCATVIGYNAKTVAGGYYGTALGASSKVSVHEGVALGSYSIASTAEGEAGYDALTGENSTDESITWKATSAAVSVGGRVTMSNGYKDVTRQITNVAAGTQDTDAVNVAQLKRAMEKANKGWKLSTEGGAANQVASEATVDFSCKKDAGNHQNIIVSNDGNNVKIDLASELHNVTGVVNGDSSVTLKMNTAGISNGTAQMTILGDSITLSKGVQGSVQIHGVAAGTADTDAVNYGQLKDVKAEAGKHTTLSNGKNTTVESTVKDGQTDYKVNVAGDLTDIASVANGDSKINLNKDSISISNGNKSFAITNSGIGMSYITADYSAKSIMLGENGTTISGGLNVAGSKITGVAAGVADTDAVNVGQLKEAVQAGNTDTHIKAGEYGVGADNTVKMDIVDKNGNKVDTVTITDVAKASDVGNVNNIASDIKNQDGSHTTVVDAVNNLNNKLDNKVGDLNYVEGGKGNYVTNGENTTTSIGKLDQALKKVADTANQGWKLSTNDGEASKVAPGETVDFSGDKKNIKISNVGTNVKVELNEDIKVNTVTANTVTAGKTSISNDGLKVNGKTYVSDNGLNANEQKITKVAEGELSATSMDAVNGSQLYATNNHINNVENQVVSNTNRINQLGSRLNKVGAGAAALAALHPMDFDPDDKLTFSAGYGNYGGENAAAIAAYYRPDEKVMFSVGGTVGNGENMVNAGVSFSLDRTNHLSNSRTAMAREILDLRAEVTELKAMVAKGGLGSIAEDKMKIFPDVAENHWAYEYIGKLAAAGIIEGYPDGNFNGDRMMSRYEFAAMLYHAMQNGVQLDSKIINEFMPEMGRIRVDRVSGNDGDRHKIERVRVNGPRNERDHYGSKLGK